MKSSRNRFLSIFAMFLLRNASSESTSSSTVHLISRPRAYRNKIRMENIRDEFMNGYRKMNVPKHASNMSERNFLRKSTTASDTRIASRGGSNVVDNGYPDFIAPSIYLLFTAALAFLISELAKVNTVKAPPLGYRTLALVTGALIWDNFVITLGSFFFRGITSTSPRHSLLKWLSYPRFTLHAIGTPLQCISLAEMGKTAGVGFLQSGFAQTTVVILSFALAFFDRLKFARSPGIVLDDHADSPVNALERDLIKFTYKEPSFTYVIPAIILALFNLVVGVLAKIEGKSNSLANWLIFAAVTALIGNGLPGPIMSFTGNLGVG